ncbi:hypothetical protein Nepgr_030047 [Nepenthes gracilis]|uniref:Uncharacterized protein n=1 Tax=Nepenthes gracilis TaxID=150966 RepID=A0AAD3TFI5_NEPGR|nr:hypothetical protein Nepgr_030047 [Nepenthes gracilis]
MAVSFVLMQFLMALGSGYDAAASTFAVASDAGMMQTPGLYRMAADVGLLAFHPHFLCGWHGFDLLETAVLATGKIQCLLLILAAVGSVSEG